MDAVFRSSGIFAQGQKRLGLWPQPDWKEALE
jgi:hypothetical protein